MRQTQARLPAPLRLGLLVAAWAVASCPSVHPPILGRKMAGSPGHPRPRGRSRADNPASGDARAEIGPSAATVRAGRPSSRAFSAGRPSRSAPFPPGLAGRLEVANLLPVAHLRR